MVSDIASHSTEGKGVAVYQEGPMKRSEGKGRSYYLDWMRIISIYLAVIFHCVQALDWVGLWTEPQTLIVHLFRAGALQIGMPVFFHISGRAEALGKHGNFWSIISQRACRLLVPFIICYLLLIPPWTYIHKQCHDQGFSDSLLQFELRYLHPTYFFQTFDPAWLWFLPVLFIVTVIEMPLIRFMEFGGKFNLAITCALGLAISFGCVKFFGFSMYFAVLLLLIPAVPGVASCLVPFPKRLELGQNSYALLDHNKLSKSTALDTAVRQWLAIQVSSCLYILTSIGLVCNMKYKDLSHAGQFIPGVALYIIFYIQGYFEVRWSSNIQEIWDSSIKTQAPGFLRLRSYAKIYQLLTLVGAQIVIVCSSPVGEDGQHRMWESVLGVFPMFPIYSASRLDDPTFAAWHVLGTWAWLLVSVSLAQAYVDEEIHSKFYKHAKSSTMIVYIFHWMFIKPYAFYVVKSQCRNHGLNFGLWKLFHLPITFCVGVGGALAMYSLCLRIKFLGRFFVL